MFEKKLKRSSLSLIPCNKLLKILVKKKKIEKCNTSLTNVYEKKKISNFLLTEKNLIFFLKTISKKISYDLWDTEKKLIYFSKHIGCHGLFLAKKVYIQIEDFLSFKQICKKFVLFEKRGLNVSKWILL
jgi:hypothetical protein